LIALGSNGKQMEIPKGVLGVSPAKQGVVSVKEIKVASPFGFKTPRKIYFKNRLSSTIEGCHRD